MAGVGRRAPVNPRENPGRLRLPERRFAAPAAPHTLSPLLVDKVDERVYSPLSGFLTGNADFNVEYRLREYFQERLRIHRLHSQQLPRANAPEYQKPEEN